MAEWMESLEGRVTNQSEQFLQFIDYQVACNNSLGEMMRQLKIWMVIDMSQFPFMPDFPGRSQGEEPGSSQAEDLGGAITELEEEEEEEDL